MMFATSLFALLFVAIGGVFASWDSSDTLLDSSKFWNSVCNLLAFLLIGMAAGVVVLFASARGDSRGNSSRLKMHCLTFFVTGAILAAFWGMHLLTTHFNFGQMGFIFHFVNETQQVIGVVFWAGLLLALQAASMFILVQSRYQFSKALPQKVSTAKLIFQRSILTVGIGSVLAAGYLGWIIGTETWRLERATRIIWGMGVVLREKPDQGGELVLALVNGISKEQAESLQEALPELRRLVVHKPEAVDTPEELEVLAGMKNIQVFDFRKVYLKLGEEQVEAFRLSRPDAVVDF